MGTGRRAGGAGTLKSLWVPLGFKTRSFIYLITKGKREEREEGVHFLGNVLGI